MSQSHGEASSGPGTPEGSPRGVYCLANDGAVDWFIALCESLRALAPASELPLRVIPYDDRTEKLEALRARYGFELHGAPDDLGRLDQIGRRIWQDGGAPVAAFRKLAAFWGPFEHFLFLDADIVVMTDPRELFDTYEASAADLLAFDWDIAMVYREGPLRERFESRGSRGINSGAFLSRRGLFDLDSLEALAADAEAARTDFARTAEQPFLNFCLDTARVEIAALPDVDATYGIPWAGISLRANGAGFRVDDSERSDHGRRVPFVHWAGFPLITYMPHKRLFLRYRLGESPSVRERAAFEARLAAMTARRVARRLVSVTSRG